MRLDRDLHLLSFTLDVISAFGYNAVVPALSGRVAIAWRVGLETMGFGTTPQACRAGKAGCRPILWWMMLVCFSPKHRTQGCRCGWHPAFPAPSLMRARETKRKTSGTACRGTAWRIHRHCERSEAIQRPQIGALDCFVASLLAM